ncbi:hypothetical protein [Paractinoplanes brasiliensis]|uniref:Uncharacterized protein n=1 Tax=Paractinoplanes brasiliensis TaxID=52695 RepID=A0A4R6JQK3_9ACTN|nr:hypothetical protein [Actinoplanes brasiliensis]TDO37982.1 hypothetical protein C8E87_1622 [Actinoplanes brasiliensis]GID31072.1 hypothetical protein Abr02nite_60550 [Actinoplanes brasiliensis]
MSNDAAQLVVHLTREMDSARSAVLDLADHFDGDDFADNFVVACDRAKDLAGILARAHKCALILLFRFGGDSDLSSLLANADTDAERLIRNLHSVREAAATAAIDVIEACPRYVDLAVRDTEVLAQGIEMAASALMNIWYPLGSTKPGADALGEATELNAGSTKTMNRTSQSARCLAGLATRVLPSAYRPRYDEEYRSELYDLAAAGASWRAQLMYAIRLIDSAWVLRAELGETAPNRSRP